MYTRIVWDQFPFKLIDGHFLNSTHQMSTHLNIGCLDKGSTVLAIPPPNWFLDGAPAKDSPTEEVADQADGPAEDKESPKEPKPQAAASPPPPPQQQEEDNEFILDGFDFSTGLSICKALDLDEDEAGTVKKSSLLLPNKAVTDPSELGNVLLRALGVNKEASCSSESKAAPPHSTNTGEFGDLCVTPVTPVETLSVLKIMNPMSKIFEH